MTITRLQRRILEAIRKNRSLESYVAGGTVLNRTAFRQSDDIDIFQQDERQVVAQAERDIDTLKEGGFQVSVTVLQYSMAEAMIRDGGEETVVQWMDDTVVRFFPVVEDPVFGFRLHDADLAVNKVMAGASRSEARDAVDLARLHRDYLSLGHLVWAAAGKTVLSPDALAEHIVRNAMCQNGQAFAAVRTSQPFDPREVVETLLKARDEALALAGRLPTETYGCLFLDRRGEPVAASAEMIEAGAVVPHPPRPYGAWPVFSVSPD
ncbi:MAG: hypothetical protein HQL38_02660 [Alphaproteobacteria bacterium]|nr:hypothetical protein [Alphaproteobacteria bacterium]